jgi:probable phosphoglycerate mutase
LSGASQHPEIDPDLAEWDYGGYEGRGSSDIVRSRPGWNLFLDGCPNGESPPEVSARADRLIARLRTLSGDIALFSHGQFGAVLGVRWIGLELVEARHFSVGPASMSVLSCDPDHNEVPVIAHWNAVAGSGGQSAFGRGRPLLDRVGDIGGTRSGAVYPGSPRSAKPGLRLR